MGLGGYLAARSDAEHYASERRREQAEIHDIPAAEAKEVTEVLGSYGVSAEAAAPVVRALQERPDAWVDFMMRFELVSRNPTRSGHSPARSRSRERISQEASFRWLPISSLPLPRGHWRCRSPSRCSRCSCSATSKGISPAPARCAALCRPPSSAGSPRRRRSASPEPFPDVPRRFSGSGDAEFAEPTEICSGSAAGSCVA